MAAEEAVMPTDREVLFKLINMYKEMPYLYNKSDKNYFNKSLREEGYQTLLETYKVLDESATVKTLKKKIDNLKTTFFRELRKVIASKKPGASAEEIYVPTLWYFDALSFLGSVMNTYHAPREAIFKVVLEKDETAPITQVKRESSANDSPTKSPQDEESPRPAKMIKQEEDDEYKAFGDYVANEIRNMHFHKNKGQLKRTILKLIIDYTEMDDNEFLAQEQMSETVSEPQDLMDAEPVIKCEIDVMDPLSDSEQ